MGKAIIIGILITVFVDILLVTGIVIVWLMICFNWENDYVWRFCSSIGVYYTVFDFVLIYHDGSYFPYWKGIIVLC